MRAAHMAEGQICELSSRPDLSVHPHTDKHTERWSKRAVISLTHLCAARPSFPSSPDARCHRHTWISRPSHALLQNTPSTFAPLLFDLSLDSQQGIQLLVFVFVLLLQTPLYIFVYVWVPGHMLKKILKIVKSIFRNKFKANASWIFYWI